MAGYRIPPGPLAEEMMRRLSLEDGTSARTLHVPPGPIDAYAGRGLPMGFRTVAAAPEPLLPLVPAFPAAVPPGVNVDDNIKEAFAANFALKGSGWFYDKVRSRGPWDYKQLNQSSIRTLEILTTERPAQLSAFHKTPFCGWQGGLKSKRVQAGLSGAWHHPNGRHIWVAEVSRRSETTHATKLGFSEA